ncbi:MAG TPA: hypothetical protein PKB06_06170, partial [Actinotalea sp.]|nr:hypothetical protein [Actinotalea sp.]
MGYAAIALAAPAPRRADGAPRVRWRAYEGWAGCGPAVFLSLAAGFALVLSGAVVTGAVGWLTAAAAPERARDCSPAVLEQCAADTDPLRDPIPVGPTGAPSGADGSARSDPADVSLPLPRGYDGFAFASLGAVVALLVTVLVAALTHLVLRRRPIPIGPPGVEEPDPWSDRVQGTRRLAALAHRAEPLVAVLAVALWLAVVAGLAVAPFDQEDAHVAGALIALPPGWESASRAVVVTAFGLLVASVVLGGSNAALSRPWGLLWDLTCFLPRVAHPFAAPSYAERAVPELRGRIDDWLGVTPSDPGAPSAGPAPGRSVVLAAHSLGAVVSVATLLARQLADGTVEAPQRIALLTFGTQLRAYFGRFFPELFGPEVLGTDPVRRARLWSDDPWSGELGQRQETTSKPRSVVGFLSGADLAPTTDGPRWRSLWRRTDYLGFPVDAYLRGDHAGRRDVDHRESEVDATSYLFAVDTHGGDVRTPEYRDRLLELAQRLGHDPSAGGGGQAPDRAGPA